LELGLDARQPTGDVNHLAEQPVEARVELVVQVSEACVQRSNVSGEIVEASVIRIPISTVRIVGTLASAGTSI